MTVRELKGILSQQPDDAEVIVWDVGFGGVFKAEHVTSVQVQQPSFVLGPFGDRWE